MRKIMMTSMLVTVFGVSFAYGSEDTPNPLNGAPTDIHGQVNAQMIGGKSDNIHPAEKAIFIKEQFKKAQIFNSIKEPNATMNFVHYMGKAAEWHIDKVGPITLVYDHGGVPQEQVVPHLALVNELNLSILSGIDKARLKALMTAALAVNPDIKVKIDAYFSDTWTTPGQPIKRSSINQQDQNALVQEFAGHLIFGDVATQ
ncbi:MAG: hypothetical protein H2057_05055 [Alphaproteobacteria bacterium]|nr:hypothetical protein [Alphaproteobacteria bacterium]